MADGTGGETCDSPIDSQGRESKTGKFSENAKKEMPGPPCGSSAPLYRRTPTALSWADKYTYLNENLDSDQIPRIEIKCGRQKGGVARNEEVK